MTPAIRVRKAASVVARIVPNTAAGASMGDRMHSSHGSAAAPFRKRLLVMASPFLQEVALPPAFHSRLSQPSCSLLGQHLLYATVGDEPYDRYEHIQRTGKPCMHKRQGNRHG